MSSSPSKISRENLNRTSNKTSNKTSNQSRIRQIEAEVVPLLLEQMLSAPKKEPPSKSQLSLRETIAKLYDGIIEMKKKGYNNEDICNFLAKLGIESIRPSTLARYLKMAREDRSEKRGKR
jgi:hypothetical protein